MYAARRRIFLLVAFAGFLAVFAASDPVAAAPPSAGMVQHLQEHFGLEARQVRGALGALLVFVREQIPAPEFQEFAESIPNAEHIMQEVKLQGVVTKPLDDVEDYEESLASLGIGQPLASQFAPAVVQYLDEAGFERQRNILARLLR